jgi:hypothetical protein
MDPNLFHLDWERTFEVLAASVVLAFILERGLALIFENRVLLPHLENKGVKELIAFVVALVVCVRWQFDAVSMIILTAHTSHVGEFVTAGVIAGGSKASVKLFRDVLGFKSTAYSDYEKQRKMETLPAQAATAAVLSTSGAPSSTIKEAVEEIRK